MFPEAEPLHLTRIRQTKRVLGTRLFAEMASLQLAWSLAPVAGAVFHAAD